MKKNIQNKDKYVLRTLKDFTQSRFKDLSANRSFFSARGLLGSFFFKLLNLQKATSIGQLTQSAALSLMQN